MTTKSDPASYDSPTYHAYLVRLWRDSAPDTWRASAQAVDSGAIVRFASMDELMQFLLSQTTDSQNHNMEKRI